MIILICLVMGLTSALPVGATLWRQHDPAVLDAVIPAAVQIAVRVDRVTESGSRRSEIIPLGSGTIISADGLILTAAHVVDLPALRSELTEQAIEDSKWFGKFEYAVEDMQLLIQGTDGYSLPQQRFIATILSTHQTQDFALLQITGDDLGNAYDPTSLALPFVPLAPAAMPDIGEEVAVLGYPGMAGGGLLTTTGTVSGYRFDIDRAPDYPTAILLDATTSSGSSGGTAINARGELIGIPLAATFLTCRSLDRSIATDCLPSGGSVTTLLPIAEVRDALSDIDIANGPHSVGPVATP
jgi:S1-C subfamily serine protease